MADLGKAYVQIMPSAQGIKKQVSDILGKDLDSVSKSVGQKSGAQIVSGIGKSMGKMGATLTKHITLPVAGAVTAIGGLVSALGWGRLTGLDSARAQLQGLGYDAESVERITQLVNEAIQGTTTTMAEGVSTAAGALAAGVKEGAELERYIKLVGDAAVGSGRQTAEMAQIFNRVQGSGKLMTQELNMIEQGMPGFAQAMADSLGVPQDEFREMVTAGKVSSDQFLDVMEGFAGDMSDAYAGSWAGIVSRTKSNIGILGEIMLGGVFEQSKESLADFLEYIRTDDVRGWFADAGQAIGQAFSNILESIQNAITWWGNLDDSVKENIITMAGIIIAAGPIFKIISKLIGVVMTAHKWFGKLKFAAGILSGAIGAISAPVAIVIGAIAALVAGLIYLWNTNEEFRVAVIDIWNGIKEGIQTAWEALSAYLQPAVQAIVDFVMEIFGGLVEWWKENNEMILQVAQNVWNIISTVIQTAMSVIMSIMQTVWPFIEKLVVFTWNAIKDVIQGAITVITGIIELFSALFTGNWSALWESVKQIVSGAVQLIWGLIKLWFVTKIIALAKVLLVSLKTIVTTIWTTIKSIFTAGLQFIFGKVSSVFSSISGTIKTIMGSIQSTISSILNAIQSVFSNILSNIVSSVTGGFSKVAAAFSKGMSSALRTVTSFVSKFFKAGANIAGNIAKGITSAVGKVTGAVKGVMSKARDLLPFSPPKDKSSPLVDIHKNGIGEQIAKGILDGQNEVDAAMRKLLDVPTDFDVLGGLDSNLALSGISGSMDYEVNSTNSRLEQLLDKLSNQRHDIYLDGDTLVGGTYSRYDREGGNQTQLTERWG